ncbi:MAG: IS110 family transposase [Syntrophobacteria bacterium]
MKRSRIQVGFDISKKKLDMCILEPDGQVVMRHHTYPNTMAGYQEVRQTLLPILRSDTWQGVDIGGESTGYYWLPFFMQLREDDDLASYDCDTYLLNSRQVHWFKKGYAEDDKTDEKDSFYVAEKLRTQRRKHVWEPDLDWLRLRFYSRYRFHLGQNLTRMKNYFWAHMFLLCNTYGKNKPFSDGLGACGRTLVQTYPDWQELQELPIDDLIDQLLSWSGGQLRDPVQDAQQLRKIIQQSFPLHPDLCTALHDLLTMTVEHIVFIERQIVQVEKWMEKEIRLHHPEVLHLIDIKGIGIVYATGIAVEIGNLQRFFKGRKWDRRKKRFRKKNLRDVEDAVAKFAGIWWPRKDSGDFKGEERRMNKNGNHYLRYYLIEAADKLRQYLPEYQAYYLRKYAETKKHQHKRALVLTARKSVGLFVGLLHRNEPYRSPEVRLAA